MGIRDYSVQIRLFKDDGTLETLRDDIIEDMSKFLDKSLFCVSGPFPNDDYCRLIVIAPNEKLMGKIISILKKKGNVCDVDTIEPGRIWVSSQDTKKLAKLREVLEKEYGEYIHGMVGPVLVEGQCELFFVSYGKIRELSEISMYLESQRHKYGLDQISSQH